MTNENYLTNRRGSCWKFIQLQHVWGRDKQTAANFVISID